MRFRVYFAAFVASAALLLGSCIKNDVPYPYKELYILGLDGDHFKSVKVSNDINNPTVVIDLEEQADIRNVNITSFDYSPEAKVSRDMVGVFDLRSAVKTDLYLYQNYEWTISATQTIERYVNMKGMLGSEIDTDRNSVKLYVNDQLDPKSLSITALKLAADVDDLSYYPSYETLTTTPFDFSDGNVKYINVTAHGRTERWTLSVELREATVELQVGAWGKMAWLYAKGDTTDSDACKFYYREAGSTTWIEAQPTTISGADFEGKISQLNPSTKYEFKASAGGVDSQIFEAETEAVPQLSNSSFNEWHKSGKTWFIYSQGGNQWWSSGNEGSTYVGDNNTTTPIFDDADDTQAVARLQSMTVSGVFAAGSLFSGSFGALSQGLKAYVKLGQPFTSRPLAIRGRVKYRAGQGVKGNTGGKLPIGDLDEGFIYCALGEWTAEEYGWSAYGDTAVGTLVGDETSPVVIETYAPPAGNTTAKYTVSFDKSSDAVIAYGERSFVDYPSDDANAKWEDFEIKLEYQDSDTTIGRLRQPTHIIIVCSSSRYGDYFVGSTGSEMCIDDVELIYE